MKDYLSQFDTNFKNDKIIISDQGGIHIVKDTPDNEEDLLQLVPNFHTELPEYIGYLVKIGMYRDAWRVWHFGAFFNEYFEYEYTLSQCRDIKNIAEFVFEKVGEGVLCCLPFYKATPNNDFFDCVKKLLIKAGFLECLEAYEAGVPVEDIVC